MRYPAAPASEIDFGESLSFIFRVPDGWKSLLIGGVLILGFPLLLIPPIFAFGWTIELGRVVARGDRQLPQFEGKQFWDGLRLSLVLSVYYLPIVLLLLPIALAGMFVDPDQAGTFSMLFLIPSIGGQIYGLGVAAITPAVYAIYIAEGTFEACFSPRRIAYVMKSRGWTYVGVAAIAYAINAFAGIGLILCLVGVVFTVFYALVVNFHLAGQLARPLVWPAVQPPSQPPVQGSTYP